MSVAFRWYTIQVYNFIHQKVMCKKLREVYYSHLVLRKGFILEKLKYILFFLYFFNPYNRNS